MKENKYLLCIWLLLIGCTNLNEDLIDQVTSDIKIHGSASGGPSSLFIPLDKVFAELRNTGSAAHGSYYSVQTICSDEMCVPTKGNDWNVAESYQLHRHTYNSTHQFISETWRQHYLAIETCNELLTFKYNLDTYQKAQVRALRAYFYFRLMDLFGSVKIITIPGQDVKQSSRSEVFEFVEKELLDVIGVPAITQTMDISGSPLGSELNANRINVYGALGVISKLYLNAQVYTGIAKFNEAAIASGKVIDSGKYRLCSDGCNVTNIGRRNGVTSDPILLEGYAAVFAPNNENNPENIFTIFYDEKSAGGMNFGYMNLHYASKASFNFQEQPWNGYVTLEEFYNSYSDADERKKSNFLVGSQLDFGGSAILDYQSDDNDIWLNYTPKINELYPYCKREAGVRSQKFSFKQYGGVNMDNDYPIVRLGELYLIRGEAKARLNNNWNLAISDVNVIRTRAKLPIYTTIDKSEFLKERGREMFQEGVRRTDLIRFGKYNDAWWEKPTSQAYRNIFPIPHDAINASAGTLKQNPGY